MPTEALQQKALQYVNKDMISEEMASRVIQAIVQERGHASILNDDEQQPVDGEAEAQHPHLTTRLSEEEMKALLAKREAMMREGGSDGTLTDQWRVYQHIIGCIQRGGAAPSLCSSIGRDRSLLTSSSYADAILSPHRHRPAGKSFLLTTVYLWCLVNGKNTKAAAPTGIAAANVEIERTLVAATTIHNLFD